MGTFTSVRCDGGCGKTAEMCHSMGNIGPLIPPDNWETMLNPRRGELLIGGKNPTCFYYCQKCWPKHKPKPMKMAKPEDIPKLLRRKDLDAEEHY